MRVTHRRSRLLFLSGILVALASVAGLALHAGRPSGPPPRAATVTPLAVQHPAPAGFVCRSAHYTLTAEIHAGS